jgi:hypothetical protein
MYANKMLKNTLPPESRVYLNVLMTWQNLKYFESLQIWDCSLLLKFPQKWK